MIAPLALEPSSWGVAMKLTFRCVLGRSLLGPLLLGPLLLGPTLLGLSGMTLAAAAPRSSPGDDSEAKKPAAAEPAESPRFLHDERRVTQASLTIDGRTVAYQADAGGQS